MNNSIKIRFDVWADSEALQFDQFENRVMRAVHSHINDSVKVKIINAMPIAEFDAIIESLCCQIRATNESCGVSYSKDDITSASDNVGLVIARTYFISLARQSNNTLQ